jgi:hypothetical protein
MHLPGAEVAQRELDTSGSAPAGERHVVGLQGHAGTGFVALLIGAVLALVSGTESLIAAAFLAVAVFEFCLTFDVSAAGYLAWRLKSASRCTRRALGWSVV